MDNRQTSHQPPRRPACPICSKPSAALHRPFCSRRCADIDLGRWLKGVYAIPTDEPAEDADRPRGEERD
jgi:endogenous inhibitor of DNA gyrase (YacG/DUF329 family)